MADPIATPYSDSLQALYDASGEPQGIINALEPNPGGIPIVPTAGQSEFLNFLQGPLKEAIQKAAADPDLPPMPVPGEMP